MRIKKLIASLTNSDIIDNSKEIAITYYKVKAIRTLATGTSCTDVAIAIKI